MLRNAIGSFVPERLQGFLSARRSHQSLDGMKMRVGRDCGFFREKLTKLLITWKEIVNRHNSLSPVDTIASH